MTTRNPMEPAAPITLPPGSRRHRVQRSLTDVILTNKLHRARTLDDADIPSTQTMRRSIDVPRSEAVTPILSPIQSRRASLLSPSLGEDKLDLIRGVKEKEKLQGEQEKKKEKKEKLSPNTDGLKQSVVDLHNFSAEVSQQVEQIHHVLLEKTNGLQVMVKALKDLAQASCDLQVGFDRAARELETDITNQIYNIGHFDSQKSTIDALQSRVNEGRQSVNELAARVDKVRKLVEGWERADRAWQEKTRKRLRITWAALSLVICLVTLLFMIFNYSSQNAELNTEPAARGVWRNTTPELEIHHDARQSLPTSRSNDRSEAKLAWEAPLADEEPLRIFDEL
ncbi:hypothetical protein TGAM01_v209385 [Trichoderma gamsii]|uniref:Uncharacterized protein n=1 Tax=Trichoderma gamsii TaxID=398673 RepID=A0A2K0TB26_9HYPO|nr:hypothetical protein TGAM01_v209385 [Trichoderma gamsii]PNP42739.1 hypothetical protein TGAMA5MH_05481 [Trichoderma gamsii]PON21798.1 hypothetical protein TGAM01_v209385 [Trichoderma gamsii]